MGHTGESRKSLNDASWETLRLRLGRPLSAQLRVPGGYLHTPDTGQGTWRVPAYP